MNIGYRINDDFIRPSEKVLSEFKSMQAANIGDCMNRNASLDSRIKPVNQGKISGPAFTVSATGGDNLLFYAALDMAHEGDVIVFAGGGFTERAVCGEIMTKYAESKKLGGFVIDGAIRDFEVLSKMDFPVFAICASLNGPYKNGPGEINFPVSVGGKIVTPGDIIVGDTDGVVVVKREEAEEMIVKVREVEEKEALLLKQISQGKGLDTKWVYQKLRDGNCEFIKEENK